MIGKTISHYKVLEKLGSGGMGDVYVAEDTKLSRKVALKVLPPEMASEERRMRFEREAKAVAALNHPNIVVIHSVEESEGTHFITMELVKGKTLRELIPKKGMELNKFFEIAIPLADAVSAAHERGITHRDLKPDNLMVSGEGRLKILDFGLAKLKQEFAEVGLSELPTQSPTQEGRILGTVAYMSPEQAEGKQIDHRSDIFSIGIILYEMITGQRPFQGDTNASILSSIIKDTPASVTDFNQEIPRDSARLIRRCLAKNTEDRLQAAKDLRNELRELKQEVDSGAVLEGTPSQQRSRVRPRLIAATVVVLVLALAGTLIYVLRRPAGTVLRLTNPAQVTSAVGVENYPTWAPDGLRLAYQSNQSGNEDIWVAQASGGEPVNLTEDHLGFDGFPSWSPDGSQIAFFSRRGDGGVYVMSALGGRPRKVLSVSRTRRGFQWSADGTELACPILDGGRCYVDIVTLSSLESRRAPLSNPEGQNCLDVSWSPNGQYFAYVSNAPGGYMSDITQIMVVSASGEEAIPLTDSKTADWSPTWSTDGQKLFFVSNRGGGMDLWQQNMDEDGKPEGEPERVTTGLVIRSTAFSRDGTKLAYSRFKFVNNVWRVPILQDRPATWADAMQMTFDEACVEYFDVSPDGKRLALGSDRGGNDDLWLMPIGGGEMEQLTTDLTPDWFPSWSPNGKEIAFFAYRGGNRDVWVMPADGGPARRLTHHESFDSYPTWSPDGREIAFSSGRSGNWDIWTVPAEGGEPRQVTVNPGHDESPVYSPDGKWLIFWSRGRDDVRGLWQIPPGGGKAEPITESSCCHSTWSPDGKYLYFLRDGNFWALSIEDGTEYPVTDFEGRTGSLHNEELVTDGQYLYFGWREDIGDIWVMDVVRE